MNELYYILDKNGEPKKAKNVEEWARWFEEAGNDRIVARDTIGDVDVSTVFLAIDHSFMPGPPLLYETMVFGGPLDGEMDRYTTKEEAIEGHKEMVQEVEAIDK